ncbi:hypothetical protein D2E26_1391 [Bifidobacterium dolichotidis]|uniref:Uncharacterized protein n=1 Tax=Bifidobacterium dolichotidis TaxID=2306976 RepID=A0A430FKD7_9BIFI|nr:DUF6020 family protein [Bifidobacterium dolichotidis]RSX53349.1 hypothetical protein D2E26_1391 [Bifidobacterium dolichotidis]
MTNAACAPVGQSGTEHIKHAEMAAELAQEIDRPRELKHPLWLSILAVVIGFGSVFTLLSPYYSVAGIAPSALTAFTDGWAAVRNSGAVAVTVLGVLLVYTFYKVAQAWLQSSRRLRILAAIGGIVLSWSIMAAGSGAPVDGATFAEGYVGHWFSYLVYNGVRWIALALYMSCVLSWVFAFTIRKLAQRTDATPRYEAKPKTLGAAWWRALKFAQPWFMRMHFGTVLIIAGIILVCWIPWIVMLSPANIGPDTVAQLVWYRTGHAWDPSSRQYLPAQYALSDHHPWLTTLLFGAFDAWGVSIGNEGLGLWTLAFLQSIVLAIAFGIVISYLCGRAGMSWKFGVIATLFVGLTPIFGRHAMVIVKDMTFMPFFMVWCVLLVEYVRRATKRKPVGIWLCIGLVALAIMCGLTKKIGMYVILATLFVLLIFMRRRIITGLMMVVILAVSMAIPKVAYPALRIAPGGPQEMIAVPLQQGAAVLLRDGNSLDEQTRNTLQNTYSCSPEELKHAFTTSTSDGAKDCFDRNAPKQQTKDFMLAWAKAALEYPDTALASTPSQFQSFLMSPYYDEGFFVRWGWDDKGGTMIMPQYQDHERSVPQRYGVQLYQSLAGLPVIGLLMTEGLYSLWLPVLAVLMCFALKRYRNLLILLPYVITMATLLVGPMHQYRYSWPLAFCSLLIVAAPFIHGGTTTTRVETTEAEDVSKLEER